MKNIFLLSILFLISITAFTQTYQQAVGIRGGVSSGFEYRVFENEFISYKALLSTRKGGIQLTALKEFHQYGLFNYSDQLIIVYGFGAHVGYEKWNTFGSNNGNFVTRYSEKRIGPVIGLDGLVAIEYSIFGVPLIVGIEAKPYFNLFGKNLLELYPFDLAFTLKYTF